MIQRHVLQTRRKQRQRILQIGRSRRIEPAHRSATAPQSNGQLIVKGLSVRQTVKIGRAQIQAGKGKIGGHLLQNNLHTGRQNQQGLCLQHITAIHVLGPGCSTDNQQEKEALLQQHFRMSGNVSFQTNIVFARCTVRPTARHQVCQMWNHTFVFHKIKACFVFDQKRLFFYEPKIRK